MLHALTPMLLALPLSHAADASSAPSIASVVAIAAQHPQTHGSGGGRAATPAPAAGPPGESAGGSPVPEPSTLLLVGGGLVGLALTSRRLRRQLGARPH